MARRRSPKWNLKFLRKWGASALRLSWKGLPLAVFLASVGLIGSGVRQMLYADPYFRAERISVFPSGILTQSEYAFLERQARGRGLIEIDLEEISQNLERNPWVKRAEVTRQLPGDLHVFLTLRFPFIQVQLKQDGPYYLVSADQLVLSVQDAPKPDLMILQDLMSPKKIYGVGTLYQNRYFHQLSEIFDSIRKIPPLSEEHISQVSIDQLGNMTLILRDGIELKVGNEIVLSEASKVVLPSLLRSDERSQILYLDLRYRDMIVRRKSEAAQKTKTA